MILSIKKVGLMPRGSEFSVSPVISPGFSFVLCSSIMKLGSGKYAVRGFA